MAAAQAGADYERLAFDDASDSELTRVHDAAYVESLGHMAGRTGYLDADTYVSPGSIGAARRAAGSGVALVRALTRGTSRAGFAAVRPPGHHALADQAMGFCLLNNVAVAAAEARQLGHERVVIVDWDVHHGNGTEAMFYADPSVLFISLHQAPNYPGTGAAAEVGRDEGLGANVNLPLPPGATDATYLAAFERVVLPIIEQFAPSLALVSCGFDAHERDPLADMALTAAGFAAMTQDLLSTLPERCSLGLMLEGGYDLTALEESSLALARVLHGSPGPRPERAALTPQHEEALGEITRVQRQYWKLP
jgi:acetoin utilization deacetylase AcuC-like enzyme